MPLTLSPAWRKPLLLVHLVSSLGWIGAVAAYLVLAGRGLLGGDDLATRAAYIGMQQIGWLAVLPLGVLSVAGGILQALGTPWGLVRQAWILAKLAISALALAVLVLHLGPTDELARAAAQGVLQPADLAGLRKQLVGDSAAAILVLLATAALGLYKPRPGGWIKASLVATALTAATVVATHLSGHSPHQH